MTDYTLSKTDAKELVLAAFDFTADLQAAAKASKIVVDGPLAMAEGDDSMCKWELTFGRATVRFYLTGRAKIWGVVKKCATPEGVDLEGDDDKPVRRFHLPREGRAAMLAALAAACKEGGLSAQQ
jgi:hypothetical protein